ncbi:MAG: hypothetical protein IT186_17265 [Acidobacteria bacterium]|nr:hypothetical protein [Acidobacteriota bacterium]MCG3192238.1 hypothetical protein [Thermoanaerobaculia bacterium]MCK6681957.1 hypothetical protein [Thermoanaerobaculia bacterium]
MKIDDEDFPDAAGPERGEEAPAGPEEPAPEESAQEPGTDPTERDFGPDPGPQPSCSGFGNGTCASGPIPGVPCGGEGCFLRPLASLVQTVFVHLSQNHPGSLRHASVSAIELMKAAREFLDEEIALAERVRAAQGGQRFHKIHID